MRRATAGALALTALALAACGAPAGGPGGAIPSPGPGPTAGADTGLDRMERLALTADRCWFDSADPSFADFSLAPELASFSGRPRFLLVPRGRPEARPLLVVEGRSGASDVSVFGPLLGQPVGARISADIDRWSRGSASCGQA